MFCIAKANAQIDVATKYAELITGAALKNHLVKIAGNEFEGRETGTIGQRLAANYIANEYKKIGLKKPVELKNYQQLYPLYKDTTLAASLAINNLPAAYGKDFLIPLNANSNNKYSAKQIVFAGYGIDDTAYNDYSNLDVKGKVVVIFLGEPKRDGKYFVQPDGKTSKWTYPGISVKLQAAAANGAVGVLIINPTQATIPQRMVDANTKANLSFESLPSKIIVNKLNYALLSHGYALQIMPAHFDSVLAIAKGKNVYTNKLPAMDRGIKYLFKKSRYVVNASNVIGIVEGTDKKDEYVFITAHYDHLGKQNNEIYYGADDDGSGTVGVIQMAAAFANAAATGNRPRRTMVFMTVSGEEKGLWGSEYYSDHPLYDLDKTSVDLNIDMVGRVDTERKTSDTLNYIYVVGHNKISSEMPIINEAANTKYTKLILDYKFDDPSDPNRIYYRSDHYNFARKGVPVLFFYDGMLKADYHKPTDTVDKINFDLFEKRVRMIFYTAWEIANRNDMLNRDKPLEEGGR